MSSKWWHLKAFDTRPSESDANGNPHWLQWITGSSRGTTKRGIDVYSIGDFTDEAVLGNIPWSRAFTKFGYREGLTAANGEETIWAATGNFVPLTSAQTFTITFNNATDGLGRSGALTLYFDYLDSSGLVATTILTLDASGSQVTSFSGFGINRVAVVESGSAGTNTNTITITATTSATIQAILPALGGVTQQAIFHCGANTQCVARYLWVNANKLSGGGSPRIIIKAYVFNRTYETIYEVFRVVVDTSVTSIITISEPVGFRLSQKDVLYFVADTDTNSSTVNLRFSLLEYTL